MGQLSQKSQNRNRPFLLFVLLGIGLMLIVAAIWFASAGNDGAPAIAVSQQKIDFGEVKLNTPIFFEFDVTNTGNSPLRFTEAPNIEVVEGC